MTARRWLRVVEAGTATVQDGGRHGHARAGVPPGGPMDVLAHRLAALLAGVAPADVGRTAAIEVGPGGSTFAVEGGAVLAVTGRAPQVVVDGARIVGPAVVAITSGVSVTVDPGAGTWAAVVPVGGLDLAPVLGSVGRHDRADLGPTLTAGRILPVGTALQKDTVRCGLVDEPPRPVDELLLLPGPQTSAFDDDVLDLVATATFTTTTAGDRMGARLDGPRLVAARGHDIVSDGVVAGAVQVPGDGRPFVLTADHQTTGGYPKVGVVARVDLARFVQLRPGAPVRFRWGNVDEARARWDAAVAAVDQAVAGRRRPDPVALGAENLVDGVVVEDEGDDTGP